MSFASTLPFAALVTAVAISIATKLSWRFQPEHRRERFSAVQAAIQNIPDPVIIFGDSIVEEAALPPRVCGFVLVNAGIGGAGIAYFQRYSAQLLGSSRPKLIVLAVGINDAGPKTKSNFHFQDRYEQTVAFLASRAPIVVATITPIQEGIYVSKLGYNSQIIPALNRVILAVPNTTAVIDLNGPLSGTNFTTDGVHLNKAGYAVWTSAIVNGISAALGCIQR